MTTTCKWQNSMNKLSRILPLIGLTVALAACSSGGGSSSGAGSTSGRSATVTISPTSLTVKDEDSVSRNIKENGGKTDYTVKLSSQPSGNVTVTPQINDTNIAKVKPATLTFTPTNWSKPQAVTVTGVDDDTTGNRAVRITHKASGGGYDVKPSDSQVIKVTVRDDDTPGVTISHTSLTVVENGGIARYTVVLRSKPSENVTITPRSENAGIATIEPATLTFTPANWDKLQVVTVTGVNDHSTGDRSVRITHAVSGGGYDVKPSDSQVIKVTVRDDDTPGVTISHTSLTVVENGGIARYTVVLGSQPSGSVTVTPQINDTNIVTVSGGPLTFTPANWATQQAVTVTGVNDNIAGSHPDARITHTVSGGGYGGVAVAGIDVIVTGGDAAGVTISPMSLTVGENGGTARYTVALRSKPSENVTITPRSDTDIATIKPTTLTFTTGNWATPQTVTVTGVGDTADDRTVRITHKASGGGYDSVRVDEVDVVVRDDDIAGVTISTTSLTVDENSGTAKYTVVLNSEPSGNVTITLAITPRSDTNIAMVKPTTLTFTRVNWNIAQSVTVTGVNDDVANSRKTTINHTPSGGGYNGVTVAAVNVTVTDDDGCVARTDIITIPTSVSCILTRDIILSYSLDPEVIVPNTRAECTNERKIRVGGLGFGNPFQRSGLTIRCD